MHSPDIACPTEPGRDSCPAHAPARAFFLDRLQSEERNLTYCVRDLSETQARIDHLRTALAHLPS